MSLTANLKSLIRAFLTLYMCLMGQISHAQEVRIKDLVNVRGVRSNQLMGVGLVVGLS